MSERPGKRTDPRKVLGDQKRIMRDVVKRTTPKETLLGRVSRKISERRARRAGYGPPPRVEGAAVVGFRKPRGEA